MTTPSTINFYFFDFLLHITSKERVKIFIFRKVRNNGIQLMYARDLQMIQFKLQIHLPVDFNWLTRSNKKKLQSVSLCFWSHFLFAIIIVFTHRMHISIVIRFFSIHHQTDRYKNDEFPPIILYFPQKLSVCALFFLFCCLYDRTLKIKWSLRQSVLYSNWNMHHAVLCCQQCQSIRF